jgi:hypothetical protein
MDAVKLLIEMQAPEIPCVITVRRDPKKYSLTSHHELEVLWENPDLMGLKFDWIECPEEDLRKWAAQCFAAEGIESFLVPSKDLVALQMTCPNLTAIWILSTVMN